MSGWDLSRLKGLEFMPGCKNAAPPGDQEAGIGGFPPPGGLPSTQLEGGSYPLLLIVRQLGTAPCVSLDGLDEHAPLRTLRHVAYGIQLVSNVVRESNRQATVVAHLLTRPKTRWRVPALSFHPVMSLARICHDARQVVDSMLYLALTLAE